MRVPASIASILFALLLLLLQNAIQLQTSIQRNPKKRSYDTADLHEDVMYGIVSTAVDWVIIKLVSSNSENNSEGKVEVLLSSLSPSPLPINNSVLTREQCCHGTWTRTWVASENFYILSVSVIT